MKSKSLLPLFLLLVFSVSPAAANPTQFGDTGLLSQPTAETLNAGNICLGLWGNFGSGEDSDPAVVPFTITMGLGSFMEIYGSYPNLLFNGDEDASGRGYANVGMKIRFLGKRSSPFKLALDGQMRRSVSEEAELDGLTDYAGKLVASVRTGRFGIHANAGYVSVEDPDTIRFENQVVYGGGLEFLPTPRLRLIAEMEAASERVKGMDDLQEATFGFQYYFSPHFTFNLGIGIGLTDASPDWRALVGFSTCQGVGSYAKPIPRIIEPGPEVEKEEEPVKKIKVRTLTPLIPKAEPAPGEPTSSLEIPVGPPGQEEVIDPADQLILPAAPGISTSPVAPIVPEGKTGKVDKPAGKPMRALVYRRFRLPDFSFEYDQWNISPEGKKALGEISEQLRQEKRNFIVKVAGYTDNIGSDRYNEELSRRRATSTASYLAVHAGFDAERIYVKGYGEAQPIADNLTPEGRGRNRRVEVLILVPQGGAALEERAGLPSERADIAFYDNLLKKTAAAGNRP